MVEDLKMTSILKTSTSPAVESTTAYGELTWTETIDSTNNCSVLDWKLTVYTSPSTNYRTINSLSNAINIGPKTYNITWNACLVPVLQGIAAIMEPISILEKKGDNVEISISNS